MLFVPRRLPFLEKANLTCYTERRKNREIWKWDSHYVASGDGGNGGWRQMTRQQISVGHFQYIHSTAFSIGKLGYERPAAG